MSMGLLRRPLRGLLAMTALIPVFIGIAVAAETLDRILVVVNDEIITEQDLRMAAEPMMAQYRATMSGFELEEKSMETRQRVLDQLIDDRLVRSAAKREKVTVDEKEIDEMMSEIEKKFPSRDVFERVIAQQGMTFAKLRERFKDQIMSRKIVDMKVKSEITISPGEVRAYYDQHIEDFFGPSQAKVRQILIRISEQRAVDEAQELAESIVQQLNKGESFEELAKKHSESAEAEQGGDMGWIDKGQLVEAIDRQIFTTQPGQYTQPIQSQLGFHIFKIEDKKESEIKSFENARNHVERIIYRKRLAEKFQSWISDLRKNAFISRQDL